MGSRLNPANWAREFDEFLLDRVFQPIVDRCGHPISIASFFIDGMLGLWTYRIVGAVMDGDMFNAVLAVIILPLYGGIRFVLLPVVKSKLRKGLRNPLRITWQPVRFLGIYFLVSNSVSFGLFVRRLDLQLLSDVLWVMAAYFAACDVLPPKPKPVRVDTARVVGVI